MKTAVQLTSVNAKGAPPARYSFRRRKFSFHFCRVVYTRSARGGCSCISCEWMRSVKRERRRRRGRSEATKARDAARMRLRYQDPARRQESLRRLREWRDRQDPLAKLIYDHMRQLVKRDGMWGAEA